MKFIDREIRLAKLRASNAKTPGQRIRVAREALDLDQKDIAKACGVTSSAVSEWERDITKDIGGRNMVLASMRLDVATRWIAMVSDDPLRYNFASAEEEELVMQYRELSSAEQQMVRTMVDALRSKHETPSVAAPYPTAKKRNVNYPEGG